MKSWRSAGMVWFMIVLVALVVSCAYLVIGGRRFQRQSSHDIDIGVQVDYPDLSGLPSNVGEKIRAVIHPYIQDRLDGYWETIAIRNVLKHPYYPNSHSVDEKFVRPTDSETVRLASMKISNTTYGYSANPPLLSIRIDEWWLNDGEKEPKISTHTFIFNAESGERYLEPDLFLTTPVSHSGFENNAIRVVRQLAEQRGMPHWFQTNQPWLGDFVVTDGGVIALKDLSAFGSGGAPLELLLPFDSLAPYLNPCGPLASRASRGGIPLETCSE